MGWIQFLDYVEWFIVAFIIYFSSCCEFYVFVYVSLLFFNIASCQSHVFEMGDHINLINKYLDFLNPETILLCQACLQITQR